MSESPLIRSLRGGISRTQHECSVPSNLAYHLPTLYDSTLSLPLANPRSGDQAIYDHAPQLVDLRSTRLVSRTCETALLSSAHQFVLSDTYSSLFSVTNLKTIWKLGSQGFNLALLARFASRVTRAPIGSNKVILPVESTETEDTEDWVDLAGDVPD